MEFFLHIDDQLQLMDHSGCGIYHKSPNASYWGVDKYRWIKFVGQIVVDCFVINICHIIISFPDFLIFLLFCVFDTTFWYKFSSFQTMSYIFIRKRDFFYKSGIP